MKKTGENRRFSGADLFRPHTMWCAVGSDRVEVKTGDFDVFQAFLTVLYGLNRSVRTALIDRLSNTTLRFIRQ